MKITRLSLIFLALGWLFFVIFNYYVVHKPFAATDFQTLGDALNGIFTYKPHAVEPVFALGDTLANTLVVFVVFLIATTIGRRITRTFEFSSALESISLRAGLGLGLFSFAILFLGLVGLLNPILLWLLLPLVFFLFRRDLFASLRDIRSFRLQILSRFDRALAAFIAVSLLIAFLFALNPPIAWDSQTYHLVEPQHIIEQGRIVPPPDIVYFSFPSLGEMLFLAAMILKGDIAAQTLHFGYILLLLGAVFAFAKRYFAPSVGWLSCAILVAVPSLLALAASAYVDVMLIFYAFASFYSLMIAFEKNDLRWYVLAGAFAGMAMGVKYTGIFIPIAIFVVILLRDYLRHLRLASNFLLSAFCFALPFYLRNLFFIGNPIYPFIFGGSYWDAFRAEQFSRFGSGLITTPLKILTAPWDATIFGLEGTEAYSATIGPLLFALLPLLLLQILNSKFQNADKALATANQGSRITLRLFRPLFIFSLILYLFWLVGISESKLLIQTRLLYPAFPALALSAAVAVDRLGTFDLVQFSLQRFTRLLIILVLGLTLFGYALAFVANSPLDFITGVISRDTFLERDLGDYYRAAKFINAELPSESKVVTLWEPRSYYIHRAIQPDVILDLFGHRLSQTRDVDAIARGWQVLGYTHILLYRKGLNELVVSQYDRIPLDDLSLLQTFLARYGRLIYGEPLAFEGNRIAHADSVPYAVYALESR